MVDGQQYIEIHGAPGSNAVTAYSIICSRKHTDPGSSLICKRDLTVGPSCSAAQCWFRLRLWDVRGDEADGKANPRTSHKAQGGFMLRDYDAAAAGAGS